VRGAVEGTNNNLGAELGTLEDGVATGVASSVLNDEVEVIREEGSVGQCLVCSSNLSKIGGDIADVVSNTVDISLLDVIHLRVLLHKSKSRKSERSALVAYGRLFQISEEGTIGSLLGDHKGGDLVGRENVSIQSLPNEGSVVVGLDL
jgi:hypothetical protein